MSRKIYTRGGDRGTTSLGDGSRVPKDSARCEAYGTVDEATALVGAAMAHTTDSMLTTVLTFASHKLYNCASRIAASCIEDNETAPIRDEDVSFLERAIDRMNDPLEPLDYFIFPAGTPLASRLHHARTVVRRAERRVVTLADDELPPTILQFINRLSDLLFTAARYANHLEGKEDIPWDRNAPVPRLPG